MLDAVSEVFAARVALESLFVGVQDHGVSAGSDGVDAHLPAPGRGLIDDAGEVLGAGEQQAAIALVVAVVLEQGGAAAAQSAVGVQLHRLHIDPILRVVLGRAQGVERFLARYHHVEANFEISSLGQALKGFDGAYAGARVVNLGEALAEHDVLGGADGLLQLSLAGPGDHGIDEIHGRVHENPRGVAVLIADELAPGGIEGVGADACGGHGGPVGPGRVAVHPAQPNGPIGDAV